MELSENINKSELIQILRFYISKESKGWFIIGVKPIYQNNLHIELVTAELTCDQARNIHYHRVQKCVENPSRSIDFLSWLRDFKITEITDESIDSFSHIDRLKIELLKIESHFRDNENKVITKDQAIQEYIENLKKGDRVLYKNMPGIITYKHKDDIKFTVNVKDTYYKYIHGSQLIKKIKRDLSHIEVPIEIQQLTTMKLLKMLKKSHNLHKGFAPDVIKAELNKREHIKRKPK
jgi:preprotein translocase subunit YajC